MIYLNCSHVASKISDIIDGQASLMTRVQFHGHLLICNNCRRYYKQFKTVKELSGRVTSADLPEDFDHVMGFVMDEIDKKNAK